MMPKIAFRWIYGAVIMGSLFGCGNELTGGSPVTSDGANLYSRLEMNHHAVLLSIVPPYDTVRLSTTIKDMNGNEWMPSYLTVAERDSILAANPPKFTTQDEARVRVNRDGLIQAVGTTTVTGTVRIIATRQLGNVTRADTTLVRVLNEPSPPRIKTFRLRPTDSLKVGVGATLSLVVTALDSANNPILRLVTYARSYNPLIVGITGEGRYSGWNVTSLAGGRYGLGSAQIITHAYVYGIAVADTITVLNGYPIRMGNFIMFKSNKDGTYANLSNPDIYVGPGGIVSWVNQTKLEPISIVFEDSADVLPAIIPAENTGGGNIIDIPFDSTLTSVESPRYRRFLRQGIYTYRTNPYGLVGRVIVMER